VKPFCLSRLVNSGSIGNVLCDLQADLAPDIVRPIAPALFVTGWVIKLRAAIAVVFPFVAKRRVLRSRNQFLRGRKTLPVCRQCHARPGAIANLCQRRWYQSRPGLLAALIYPLAVISLSVFRKKLFEGFVGEKLFTLCRSVFW
jgi:hypothetical protein